MNADLVKELLRDAGIDLGAATPAGPVTTPSSWLIEKFPAVAEKFGEPVHIGVARSGRQQVKDLSDDFFAALLGQNGMPEAPTCYLAEEGRFYRFNEKDGIYIEQSKQELSAILSAVMRDCAKACTGDLDTTNLLFRLATSARLNGVVDRAKGLLGVPANFFDVEPGKFIVCRNGVLQLENRQLLPFHPQYHRRNKLGVDYVEGGQCPMFLDQVLKPALCAESIDHFQRWSGLALIGVNLAQAILILEGASASGKGTVARVVNGILGRHNLAAIRTKLLGERFEIGGLLGRTLLYGADVPSDFLNNQSAHVLKSLTGGDPMTVELKGSNTRPEITARFNVLLTTNARLKVRFDGDVDAWRRRLHVIHFGTSNRTQEITDLSERILQSEGPGVLNFMLDGFDRLRADGFGLRRTPYQQRLVDDILDESASHKWFVADCFILNPGASVTVTAAYDQYVRYCADRGWTPLARFEFTPSVTVEVNGRFGVTHRNDIPDHEGKAKRGWKGLALK